jgi:uncharacterized protein
MTFDPTKERRNLEKHGISLSRISDMTAPLAIYSPRDGEDRWVVIGWIEGRLHAGVIANRDGGVREISLRRANRREEKDYARAYPLRR